MKIIHSKARHKRRHLDKDAKVAAMNFDDLLDEFHHVLFNDIEIVGGADPFTKYNEIWKNFCSYWNKNNAKNVHLNPMSFYDYAIKK